MTSPLVVIGTSLGGLAALPVLLSGLPVEFASPVAIVQHRVKGTDSILKQLLQGYCPLPLSEATDKLPIRPGAVYLAPADYHLLVDDDHFALSTDPPVQYSRPSIDVLFESAALVYRENLIAVVLTGANRDGATGAARVKEVGGLVIVQDPAEAESRVMPEAVLRSVTVDYCLPLAAIPPLLARLCAPETAL